MLREYSKKFLALDVFALGFVLVNGWAIYWDSTVEDAVLPLKLLSRWLTGAIRSLMGDPEYALNIDITVRSLSMTVFVLLMALLIPLYCKEFHAGGKAVRLRYFLTMLLIAACFFAEFYFHRIFPAPVTVPSA